MDKVYIVFAGEQYASHNLVSVHSTDEAALEAAHSYMEKDEDIAAYMYKADRSGRNWVAKSGHYVTIETHSVR